ncbi:hypothetical protein RI103_36255 [Paraburkholderia sp. FT54]|uniref:hypothetical protein n=1 Tax=Paraburkholderia sp. FT54 TaxID=3074437 RepID=UPI00287794A5|nr:hypothetical protein [Paraburkholderia sp. FT54]WNC94595.1 hypothetical protein RI103_36255 [Paraburkholderia sp. FT54]
MQDVEGSRLREALPRSPHRFGLRHFVFGDRAKLSNKPCSAVVGRYRARLGRAAQGTPHSRRWIAGIGYAMAHRRVHAERDFGFDLITPKPRFVLHEPQGECGVGLCGGVRFGCDRASKVCAGDQKR